MKKILFLFLIFNATVFYSQNAWERKNDFLYENGVITSFSLNGNGYVLKNHNNEIIEVYSYNPNTDTYEQKNNLPIYEYNFVNFVLNNTAYIMYPESNWNQEYFIHLYKYIEIEDNWIQMSTHQFQPDQSGGLDYFTFSINDKGYLLESPTGKFIEYDPINDTWTAKGDSPVQYMWDSHGTFSIGDYGYVAFADDGVEIHPIFYSYNQLTDTWSQLEDVPYFIFSTPSFSFTIGDDGYLGTFDIGTNYFIRYSQTNNSWERINRCPNSIMANGNFNYVIKGKAYVGTRNYETNENRQVWKMDPEFLNTRDFLLDDDIKLFPNPTSSFLNIESELIIDYYSILNLTGREVMLSTKFNNKINVSTLNSGTFILKLENTESNSYHYFIKE